PALYRSTGRIAVAQADLQAIRVLTGLAVIRRVNRVGEPRYSVDLSNPLHVAGCRGVPLTIDADAGRLHLHPGVVVDIVEMDFRGRRIGLEPGVETKVGLATADLDPAPTGHEVR